MCNSSQCSDYHLNRARGADTKRLSSIAVFLDDLGPHQGRSAVCGPNPTVVSRVDTRPQLSTIMRGRSKIFLQPSRPCPRASPGLIRPRTCRGACFNLPRVEGLRVGRHCMAGQNRQEFAFHAKRFTFHRHRETGRCAPPSLRESSAPGRAFTIAPTFVQALPVFARRRHRMPRLSSCLGWPCASGTHPHG